MKTQKKKEYIWQTQVLEMIKDEPQGGIFAETPIKPGHEKEKNTDN
jgi:hypothetical protein